MRDKNLNILSIQSHVAYGHVGNSAAVFPMQRLGCEVWPIHTVQFSNHLGYGDFKGQVFSASLIDDCVAGIFARGALARCDGVLSGYMGSTETGAAILRAVGRTRAANGAVVYCCDPVMGDREPGFYVRADLPAFIRSAAIPAAEIVTPNQFELEWLAGFPIASRDALLRALKTLHGLGPKIILATSLETDETPKDAIDLLVSDSERVWRVRTPRLHQFFSGAGDLVAALFLVHWLRRRSAPEALGAAVSSVFGVLRQTLERGEQEIALVAAQQEFLAPSTLFVPETV